MRSRFRNDGLGAAALFRTTSTTSANVEAWISRTTCATHAGCVNESTSNPTLNLPEFDTLAAVLWGRFGVSHEGVRYATERPAQDFGDTPNLMALQLVVER